MVDNVLHENNVVDTKNDSNHQMRFDYIAETNYDLLYIDIDNDIKNNHTNLFDVDFEFIKQCYNFEALTNEEIISFVKKNNYINYVFHPKQLYNLFNDQIKLLTDENKRIYVNYRNEEYTLVEFIKHIETYSYDTLKKICVREIRQHNFRQQKLLIIVYIGDKKNILSILNKIKRYSIIERFSIAFCINYKLINPVTQWIKRYFYKNYIIYSSNELGNDITPSLLVYDEIMQKYEFDYVIKLHTKTDLQFLNKAIDFLLKSNIETLLSRQNPKSSSIGFEYVKKPSDKFNKSLYFKFRSILVNNEFVPGTIFFTKKNTMDNVSNFFKDNYKILFLQNMYDNNSLNKNCSYVHFLERLFGYV